MDGQLEGGRGGNLSCMGCGWGGSSRTQGAVHDGKWGRAGGEGVKDPPFHSSTAAVHPRAVGFQDGRSVSLG
jgi:hypothetical protein